ncbi:hypothetical protein M8312_00415 [Sphingomonas sp. KRR8]|uniref:hypothetical protein n=1 Tax=Sphingomonas sp. KRR8 TaxID=2942996 RepID=UPI0020216B35|nr:hypothetical protein [Sphingomonas sp. KRR8]URD61020.1 hypothetical protein M8312_00415 [Sphingomonas sp. KRR8]
MKHAFLIAGAALAVIAAPAAAKPGNGHGHGNGHGGDRDRWEQRDQGDRGDRYGYGYNDRGCPPGLAKKHNGCMPPGQARRLNRGDRYAQSYGYRYYNYNSIPYDVRERYDLNRNYRYYSDNSGYLYGVDPRTQVVQQIIQALIR